MQWSTSRPHGTAMILRQALYDMLSNRPRHTHPQVTDSIAWAALVQRLVTKDEEAFSGWMLTTAGRFALAKRYFKLRECTGRLQLREEQPSSLQIRRIKTFREPGVHVLKPTSRVV